MVASRFATTFITLPLGLAHISASFKKKFNVQVIDFTGDDPKKRVGYCKDYFVEAGFSNIIKKINKFINFISITIVFTHEWL